jgi:hypothetical protein
VLAEYKQWVRLSDGIRGQLQALVVQVPAAGRH